MAAGGLGVTALAGQAAAATEVPKPDREVNMADVLKKPDGALPDMTMGKADAPVKMVEYLSMTCPHCAHFAVTTFPELKKKYIDTGKVEYILREFPFDPAATAAFMLARCAPKDDYFPFIEMFYKQQADWAAPANGDVRGAMLQLSKVAGFTQESFQACLTNTKLAAEVTAVRDRGAKEFGVNATPTFIINGKVYAGDMPIETVSAIIDSML